MPSGSCSVVGTPSAAASSNAHHVREPSRRKRRHKNPASHLLPRRHLLGSGRPFFIAKQLILLARSERFELPTLGIEIRCSIQLSYERQSYYLFESPCFQRLFLEPELEIHH
jgi:hypothetical protein